MAPASQETVTAASAEADGKVCLDFSYKHCMRISVVVHHGLYGKQFVLSALSLTQYALQSIDLLASLILVCAVAGNDEPFEVESLLFKLLAAMYCGAGMQRNSFQTVVSRLFGATLL